jgi:hypothetical protein
MNKTYKALDTIAIKKMEKYCAAGGTDSMFEKTGRLDSEHNHTSSRQTSPPREKVRAVFWHQMSLLLF